MLLQISSTSLIGGALLFFFYPHVERYHWLIHPPPNAGLMGAADASSLLFKIYAPTRLAINHRAIAQCAWSSSMKLRAQQFITGALLLPMNPTHSTR